MGVSLGNLPADVPVLAEVLLLRVPQVRGCSCLRSQGNCVPVVVVSEVTSITMVEQVLHTVLPLGPWLVTTFWFIDAERIMEARQGIGCLIRFD